MQIQFFNVYWKKLALAAMIICFVSGLIIPLRLLFNWPLTFYWDYASHITGTKIMLEDGCAQVPEWGGYSVCTKSAPGFYITASIFARLVGVKSGMVFATLFYIALYFYIAWRLIKKSRMDKALIILSLFGTSFTFWWFFKVGRVLELSATVFAALFLISERERDKFIFSSLAIIHHPTILVPLLLLSKRKATILKSVVVTSPYLLLISLNAGFAKWPAVVSARYFINLLQAGPFLPFLFPLSGLLTLLYSESLLCSSIGTCLFTKIPIIRSMFPESLIPLAVFQLYRALIHGKYYRLMTLLTLMSVLIFTGRQVYSFKRFDSPEFLLPTDESKEWTDSQLSKVNGTFTYACDRLYEYPSNMIMAAYAFTEYGLESTYSPFPEFIDTQASAEYNITCPT